MKFRTQPQTGKTDRSDRNMHFDYMEANAIRYMAGYVVHSLKGKNDTSTHPLQVQLALCLGDLEEDIGELTLFQLLYKNYHLFILILGSTNIDHHSEDCTDFLSIEEGSFMSAILCFTSSLLWKWK